jgi:hypothetical protein
MHPQDKSEGEIRSPRLHPLPLSSRRAAILREELEGWIAGIEEDLATPGGLSDPEGSKNEAEAFRRLLAAVESGEIVLPDEEARVAFAAASEGYEEAASYEKIVAFHDAYQDLLDVLGGAGSAMEAVR